jgi:putative SOS response-associated peptidase YedK
MCERYVIPAQTEVEQEFRLAHPWWKFEASFNVASARNVPVIRMHQGESEGVMMRWGLIPDWAQGKTSAGHATHAATTDLEASKLFRDAWSRGQRCIMPAAGFYGWQLTPAGYRQPFFIRLVNRMVFGFAALWDRTVVASDDQGEDPDDDVIESCALITVPPNPLMAEINNTAAYMPAILHRDDYDAWLTAPAAKAKSLLRPYPAERMLTHAVSPRLNSLKYDDAWLLRPIGDIPDYQRRRHS